MPTTYSSVRPDNGVHPPAYNRLEILLAHAPRYAFETQARIAKDSGVSPSTISRLIRGKTRPTFDLAYRIIVALEEALGRSLDPREVFSPDGTYPTRSGCELCGCSGCMPDKAFTTDGSLKPEYRTMRPSDWTLAPENSVSTAPIPNADR